MGCAVDEGRLSNLLVEFAQTLTTDYSVQTILDHLTTRILESLPVSGAGVMLTDEHDEMHFISATDDVLHQIEPLQIELGEGPCLRAFHTGEQVLVPDLANDPRFPRFGPRAAGMGMAAVFSFPMRSNGVRIGAADMYQQHAVELDRNALLAGQVLADVSAAYIQNARRRWELHQSEEAMRHRALHDPLTNLPNRTLLFDRMAHAIDRSRREPGVPAALFIDLDRFKAVNDNLGHAGGDATLLAVAERLHRSLRPGDTLARLGGDEFVILCDSLAEAAHAVTLAHRVANELKAPITVAGQEIVLTASIGIALADGPAATAEALLHDADMAMYEAKSNGGGRFAVIGDRTRERAIERTSREEELRSAVANGQLELLYQPIVAAADRRVAGVEALLRWRHPTMGLLRPDSFLPVAEETGLITSIGTWVLEQACRSMARWQRTTGTEPRLSVNVSPLELSHPRFAENVDAVLRRTNTEPSSVCLEVTEHAFMAHTPAVATSLFDLKRLGVDLAIDDFGTGYCSLAYLKRVPADTVKIDQTFVAGLGVDDRDHAIVRAITELAHDLGMVVVAEGVETQRHLADTLALGCDFVQGFALHRPLDGHEIHTLLTAVAPA
jgi:diguanylate cyclase (GGDEF)-like protein